MNFKEISEFEVRLKIQALISHWIKISKTPRISRSKIFTNLNLETLKCFHDKIYTEK